MYVPVNIRVVHLNTRKGIYFPVRITLFRSASVESVQQKREEKIDEKIYFANLSHYVIAQGMRLFQLRGGRGKSKKARVTLSI